MPAFEPSTWLRAAAENTYSKPEVAVDDRPAQADIWNAIQADVVDKSATTGAKKAAAKPYVHPLVRRSSSLMSQKSLEVCTESLGSETGSGDFTASLDDVDMASLFGAPAAPASKRADQAAEDSFWQQSAAPGGGVGEEGARGGELPLLGRDAVAATLVPAAAPVHVEPRRAVPADAPSPPGRARRARPPWPPRRRPTSRSWTAKLDQDEEVAAEVEEDDEVEEEEEEVEVVDRGTVVEVKVSTQPQTPTAAKVHRSTLVINKFVGSTPLTVADLQPRCNADAACAAAAAAEATTDAPAPALRRVPSSTSTTTLAAAVAVASTSTDGDDDDDEPHHPPGAAAPAADTKQLLLFTSRCRDKQELLQSVRQCRQLRQKPLFILEPYCIATS
ncbi:hypothetical protein OsJ_12276 [Oryza sativa Japonica Group]|uniref:Uncharacterized protein n=1 Tax=Oryza sativa subsp. japonica TaxID=39947 RepID=A3ALW3_ORYSJ|nr:hypothetical protein OsJ_12276 [Oryza sativa Japonica Group]